MTTQTAAVIGGVDTHYTARSTTTVDFSVIGSSRPPIAARGSSAVDPRSR
jgi:hypothetical protein